jgi:hypothetical protein
MQDRNPIRNIMSAVKLPQLEGRQLLATFQMLVCDVLLYFATC